MPEFESQTAEIIQLQMQLARLVVAAKCYMIESRSLSDRARLHLQDRIDMAMEYVK